MREKRGNGREGDAETKIEVADRVTSALSAVFIISARTRFATALCYTRSSGP